MENLDGFYSELDEVMKRKVGQVKGDCVLTNTFPRENIVWFYSPHDASKEIAKISQDGIMRFTVEANDENAARFVECIESLINRRLNGIEVETRKEVK